MKIRINFVNDWEEDYFNFIQITYGEFWGVEYYFSFVVLGLGFQITFG